MKRIHLSPRLYNSLQNFVHRGHQPTFKLLIELLGLRPGETVVEVGCGTGLLAHHFVNHGYNYWGIDVDVDRIRDAKRHTPKANFLVGNGLTLMHNAGVPQFQHAFIHSVMHHLDDSQCLQLINHLLPSDSDKVLVVMEPFRPSKWWLNPLWDLFARGDEGQFVRTFGSWQDIFGGNIDLLRTRSLWPRWPVKFIEARLISKTRNLQNTVLDSSSFTLLE